MQHEFDRVVSEIYATSAKPLLWPQALAGIASLFDDIGALLVYSREDGTVGTIVSPGLDAAQREYEQRWWSQDIRFQRSGQQGFLLPGNTITDRHVATEDEISSHPFYVEFLRPHGLGWLAGTAIAPTRAGGGALSVQRRHHKAPYSDEELELLERLGRHVEAALRLGMQFLDARLGLEGLGRALSAARLGVVLVDEKATVLLANDAAKAILGVGLAQVGGRLTARDPRARSALAAAIAAVTGGAGFGDPRPVVVRERERTLALHVLPVPRGDNLIEQSLSAARAMVLVSSSVASDPPDPAVVRDMLSLTLGEARIGALVGWGIPPRRAAEQLGIGEETVRTVLKRIFAKAGVSRQSELVALLHRLLLR